MHTNIIRWYLNGPRFLKSFISFAGRLAPIRVKYGKVFWKTYNFLKKSEWWDKKKFEDYQIAKLRELLNYAYKNIPYYQRIFNERRLKPKYIQNIDDLKSLPVLTKDIYKKKFKDLVAVNLDHKLVRRHHTSGTTGKPLQFYEHFWTIQMEHAFIYHLWSRVGFKPGDSLMRLRGTLLSDKLIFYDAITNTLNFTPKFDGKRLVKYYLQKMAQFGGQFLHGYPSAIALFALTIKKYNFIVPFRLKAVFFASETIYSWEKEIVEEVFNCRIFNHYGMAEKVVLAGACEKISNYHCLPQYGIVEIDKDNNEIIGTGFLNYANPFVRYRTTDIVSSPVTDFCPQCGRAHFPIFPSVEGRLEDFIITTDGVPISPAVITFPFKDLKTIKDTQIVQKSPNHITLKIIPWTNIKTSELESELMNLCFSLRAILGENTKIDIETVKSISRLPTGKFRWIISNVSADYIKNYLK